MIEFIRKNYDWVMQNSAVELRSLRQNHFETFLAQGLPTKKQEDWRGTDLTPLLQQSFSLKSNDQIAPVDIQKYLLPNAYHLVFIDGQFIPNFSNLIEDHWQLLNLNTAIRQDKFDFNHFRNFKSSQSFAHLNLALWSDGAYIYLPKGYSPDKPIQLLFYSCTMGLMQSPHNIIVADQASQLTVIETFFGADDKSYFNNVTTQIIAKADAQIRYYKLQMESKQSSHIANISILQDQASQTQIFNFGQGAQLARDHLIVQLQQSRASTHLYGLYGPGMQQHHDHHTHIEHQATHCESTQLYKGILNNQSSAIFNGQITVQPKAQQTKAQQMNHNLLLSQNATIDTKPELAIFADDVQCTHGATIGQLDEESLFYLRSRGINEDHARQILLTAFANEIYAAIPDENINHYINRFMI